MENRPSQIRLEKLNVVLSGANKCSKCGQFACRYIIKPLTQLLQLEKPTCGIVALAMCSETPTDQNVEIILQRAKTKGYSRFGEMFSALNMAELARDCLPGCEVSLYTGYLDTEEIRENLFAGNLFLVPFDMDWEGDGGPGLLEGTKAHWAVVCGARETDKPDNFFVYVRHGTFKGLCRWRLARLAKSNAQLRKVSVVGGCPSQLVLPEGGVAGPLGICSKAVRIRPRIYTRHSCNTNT